jgi:hypothetical protein
MSRRFQYNLRTLFALTAAAAVVCLVVPTIYGVCDVIFHGPQVVYFNERCERIVRSQGLIGKPPEIVIEALGEPTSVYDYGEPGGFTLNYAPHPWFPFAQFQAHFTNGKLSGTELFDD